MKVHALLACFLLPVCVMFFVTGLLYTLGLDFASTSTTKTISAPASKPSLSEAVSLVEAQLKEDKIATPTGAASIRGKGDSGWQLQWGGAARDVSLAVDASGKATMTVRESSLLRRMMQFHKAKGGAIFKWFGVLAAVGLLVILITGVWLSVQVKALKRLSLIFLGLGTVVWLILFLTQ